MKYADDSVIRMLQEGRTPDAVLAFIHEKQPKINSDFYSAVGGLEFLVSADHSDLREEPYRSGIVAFLARVKSEVPRLADRVPDDIFEDPAV